MHFDPGHFPLSATLFRGPGVQYDTDTITFSSCAHDMICSDLQLVNKAEMESFERAKAMEISPKDIKVFHLQVT